MTQEQVNSQSQKQTRKTEQEDVPQEKVSQEEQDHQDKLSDDVVELLDEIDDVLSECAETEEQAQAWVSAFVQKGGQ